MKIMTQNLKPNITSLNLPKLLNAAQCLLIGFHITIGVLTPLNPTLLITRKND